MALLRKNIFSVVALIFQIFGVIIYFRFNYRLGGSKSLPVKIVEIEDINYEHLTFLTTYIIPLICFNLTSERYIFALVFLLIVIGVIYVKTDMFYANPTLAVLGYRLYKVKIETRTDIKENIVVIARCRLSEGEEIRRLELDEKVCFGRSVSEYK